MKKLSLVLLALLPLGIEAVRGAFQDGYMTDDTMEDQVAAPGDVVEEEFSDAGTVKADIDGLDSL